MYGAAFLNITGCSLSFVTMVYKPFNFPQYENMDLSIIVSAWQGSNMQKILQKTTIVEDFLVDGLMAQK